MEQKIINFTKTAIDDLVRLATTVNPRLWVDYDKQADVLYINFGQPQKADDSYHGMDGIITRKKTGKIIGLTILNASGYTTKH